MKKTLLAVAVAALPAVAFAQTNVTLSGNIKSGVSMHKFSNGASGNGSGNTVGDGSSKFIISGSEDLGGGLRAIFQWDNRLRPDDAGLAANSGSGIIGNELAGGNSFVGVAGGFGQVRLGRLDQYYGMGIDGHAVARAQSLDDESRMSVAHAPQHDLAAALPVVDAQGWVLGEQSRQGLAQLVLVGGRMRGDRHRQLHRVGAVDRRSGPVHSLLGRTDAPLLAGAHRPRATHRD